MYIFRILVNRYLRVVKRACARFTHPSREATNEKIDVHHKVTRKALFEIIYEYKTTDDL